MMPSGIKNIYIYKVSDYNYRQEGKTQKNQCRPYSNLFNLFIMTFLAELDLKNSNAAQSSTRYMEEDEVGITSYASKALDGSTKATDYDYHCAETG